MPPGDKVNLPADTVIWTFTDGKTDSAVIVNHSGRFLPGNIESIPDSCSWCYVLPFAAIGEFSFQYPENTRMICRYIDKNEA
jgi:hypothetical protein